MPVIEDPIAAARQKARPFQMILVTGGSGYIGSHTVLEILIAGYGVVVVDNLSNSHWESLVRVHWIAQQDYIKRGLSKEDVPPLFFHEVDICDKDTLQSVFETWKAEEFELPKKFGPATHRNNVQRSTPKDIGAVSLKQHYRCKEFSISQSSQQKIGSRSEALKITAVIHFAALKSVGESVAQPLEYYRTNVGGLLNILELMKDYKVKQIVFSSSAVVYGQGKEVNIREDSVQVGGKGAGGGLLTNPYGRSKWMSEEILNDNSIADAQLDVIALRYFNPTGSHPSGLIGEDPKGTPNNIIPVVLQAFQRRRSKVYVYGGNYDTADGTGVRDYIHVIDLARGHLAAIRKLGVNASQNYANMNLASASPTNTSFKRSSKNLEVPGSINAVAMEPPTSPRRGSVFTQTRPNYRCYNLGTGQGHSVLEILNAFSNVCGKDIPFAMSDARVGDLGTVTADVSKATTELGWYAEFGLQDMCRDVYQWAVENPQGYERLRRLSMMAQVDPAAMMKVMETVDEDLEEEAGSGDGASLPNVPPSPNATGKDFGDFIRRLSVLTVDDSKYRNAMRRASSVHEGLGALLEEDDDESGPGYATSSQASSKKNSFTGMDMFSNPFSVPVPPGGPVFSSSPEWKFNNKWTGTNLPSSGFA